MSPDIAKGELSSSGPCRDPSSLLPGKRRVEAHSVSYWQPGERCVKSEVYGAAWLGDREGSSRPGGEVPSSGGSCVVFLMWATRVPSWSSGGRNEGPEV